MNILPATSTPPKPPLHWPSLLQLIFSALAAAVLLGVAALFIITGVSELISGSTSASSLTQPFMIAGSLAFAGVLVIPSAWYALRNITHPGLEPPPRREGRYFWLILTVVVLVVVGASLALGNWVAQNEKISWFILPILNIIATGLPALWVIYFGSRGLLPNKRRYTWGVFASGLVLGPTIILFLELILIAVVGAFALFWVVLNPANTNQLNHFVQEFQYTVPDPQAIINTFLPFLLNPVVIFLVLATVSVLVPIIEESLKPLGLWFLSGQKITPAQGFGFGILSGAAFGLFENLGNTSGAGAGWAPLALSRISTLLLHSFTAGLVGWALASAWTQRRFLRLALSFLLAVAIHGTWNGLAVLSAGASLEGVTSVALPAGLQLIGMVATIAIFGLGLLVLVLFFAFNSVLRRSVPAAIPPAPVSGELPGIPLVSSAPGIPGEPSALPPWESEIPPLPEDNSSPSIPDTSQLPPGEESTNTTEKT